MSPRTRMSPRLAFAVVLAASACCRRGLSTAACELLSVPQGQASRQTRGSSGAGLGQAIAFDGDFCVVSSPGNDTALVAAGGETLLLTPSPELAPLLTFGYAVAMAADLEAGDVFLAVGSSSEVVGGATQLAIFTLRSAPLAVVGEPTIIPGPGGSITFGAVVAASASGGVVCSDYLARVDGEFQAGKVFVYQRVDRGWTLTQEIVSPAAAPRGTWFGNALAVGGREGQWLAVSASGEQPGTVFLYRLGTELAWHHTQTVQELTQHRFGLALAMSEERLVANSFRESEGTVFVYRLGAGQWEREARLPLCSGCGGYGAGLAVRGDRLLVGIYGGTGNSPPGQVELLKWSPSKAAWQSIAFLMSSTPAVGDWFGFVVSLQEEVAVAASTQSNAVEVFGIDSCGPFGNNNCDGGGRATCVNLEGGFNCSCNPGFIGDGTSGSCVDVDACVDFPCGGNATCVDLPAPAGNNDAGRGCTCNNGFAGDGFDCRLIAKQGGALSAGAIVGLAAAIVVALGIIAYCLFRRRRKPGNLLVGYGKGMTPGIEDESSYLQDEIPASGSFFLSLAALEQRLDDWWHYMAILGHGAEDTGFRDHTGGHRSIVGAEAPKAQFDRELRSSERGGSNPPEAVPADGAPCTDSSAQPQQPLIHKCSPVAEIIVNSPHAKSIKAILLNFCFSHQCGLDIVAALDVPVVAAKGRIDDTEAAAFGKRFFTLLITEGYPVEAAFAGACAILSKAQAIHYHLLRQPPDAVPNEPAAFPVSLV